MSSTPKDAPKATPAATKQEKVAPSKEAPKQTAKEAPKQIAKEAPKQAPKEAPKQAPKETPKQAPKETPKQAPKEIPKEAPKQGDKGNPHYAKELEKQEHLKDIEKGLEGLILTQLAVDKMKNEDTKVKQDKPGGGSGNTPIAAKIANVTGDKGNVHYAKELDKQENRGEIEKSLESAILSMDFAKKDDTKATKSDGKNASTGSVEEPIVAKDVSKASSKSAPNQKSEAAKVESKEAPVQGDKGNPHYAKELDKQSKLSEIEKGLEGLILTKQNMDEKLKEGLSTVKASIKPEDPSKPIEPKATNVCGDKGNPHYAKELEKKIDLGAIESKLEGLVKSVKSEEAATTSPPKGNATATTSPPKGNAEEIIKKQDVSTTSAAKPAPEKAEKANITGDKGNIHYAKELDKKADMSAIEKGLEGLIIAHDAMKAKAEEGSKLIQDKVSSAATAAKATAAEILPKTANVTGDKGNIHYAKELEKQKEVGAIEKGLDDLIVDKGGQAKQTDSGAKPKTPPSAEVKGADQKGKEEKAPSKSPVKSEPTKTSAPKADSKPSTQPADTKQTPPKSDATKTAVSDQKTPAKVESKQAPAKADPKQAPPKSDSKSQPKK